MWIQLDDKALARAAKILRQAGEQQSADRIEMYLEDAAANQELYDKYRDTARMQLSDEDDVDSDAVVSCGDDPGAYVACWKWVADVDAGVVTEEEANARDEAETPV